MNKSRWPEIGDLLIETSAGEEHMGLIYKRVRDKWSGNIFVKWIGKPPYDYYDNYGYSGTNIHNQIDKFKLVKA